MMSHPRLSTLAAATLLTVGMVTACSSPNSPSSEARPDANSDVAACAPEFESLAFAMYPSESQASLAAQWDPFLADMSDALGRDVEGFFASDYAGIIEGMGAGKVQIALLGGKSYIEAAVRSQAEAFAQGVEGNGTKGYYSYLITNKDHPMVAEIDLEAGNGDEYVLKNAGDLTFAFNDLNSTSGFLVPSYYVFAQNKVVAEDAFAELIFAGSHEATALSVAENRIDVATNNSDNLSRMAKTAPEAFEKIQIIWTSPVIPSDPFAYRADLPDCLKEEIQEFMYTYDNTEVLADLEMTAIDPADDAIWDTVRELEYSKQMIEVQNDDTLTEAAKQEQLADIEQKLEALKQ